MDCEFCGADVQSGALACPRCGGPAPKQAQAGPPQGEPAAPHDVPLARLEEDVFALAEETVVVTEEGELAMTDAPRADAVALADTEVPPGVDVAPEVVSIDGTLTGGYKGPQGPSVAGAGFQTPDDPFGLNVTEAPPDSAAGDNRGFDFRSTWNIIAMVLALLAVLAIISAGLYFGLIRKSAKTAGPAGTVREFFELAIAGDTAGMDSLATTDSELAGQVEQVLLPYSRQGAVTIKSLDVESTGSGEERATVEITGFDVDVMTGEGMVTYNLLEHTKPFPLPVRIDLENRDGTWLITN